MHILYHRNNVLSSSKSKKMADFAVTAGGLAQCESAKWSEAGVRTLRRSGRSYGGQADD